MVGVLILSHGPLARELLASASRISQGPLDGFEALSLDWQDQPDEAREKIRPVLERLATGHDGVLVLADIFGGTPCNVAMGFQRPGEVEIVAGVNLPMVVRLGCVLQPRQMPLGELATWIRGKGRESIVIRDPAKPCRSVPGC